MAFAIPPAGAEIFSYETHTSGPEVGKIESTAFPLDVLVADDTPVNQTLALNLLERAGHRVTLVDNGAEAVAKWRQHRYDLILMDVQMPELDGLEATRQIRAEEKASGQHVPIVAVTAHAMAGDRDRCLTAGMDDYIGKPIQRQQLLAMLARRVQPTDRGTASTYTAAHYNGVESQEHTNAGWETSATLGGDHEVLDLPELLGNLSGDEKVLCQLIDDFLDDCGSVRQEISDAVAAQDAVVLERSAHTLKGNVAVFHARPAARAALALEQIGRSGDLQGSTEALAALRDRMEELEDTLRAVRKARAPESSIKLQGRAGS
jgi:CheY-like chemotaxis protein/HPt (histidine-containing phosphotransfer) domain-containing protein